MAQIENSVNGLVFRMDIQNPTGSDVVMRMLDKYSGQSQTSDFYEYDTIYVANYLAGDSFRVTFPDSTYLDVAISTTTARENVIPLLNALGIGTWSIDITSTALNTFRLRPAVGVSVTSFAVKIYQALFSDDFSVNTGWTLSGMDITSDHLAMILNDYYKTGVTKNIPIAVNKSTYGMFYSQAFQMIFLATQSGFYIYDIVSDSGSLYRGGLLCWDCAVDEANGYVYYSLNNNGFIRREISSGIEVQFTTTYSPANGAGLLSNYIRGLRYNPTTHELIAFTRDASGANGVLWIWNTQTDTGTLITPSTIVNGDSMPVSSLGFNAGFGDIDIARDKIFVPFQDVGLWIYERATNTGKFYNNLSGVSFGDNVSNAGALTYYPGSYQYVSSCNCLYGAGITAGVWGLNLDNNSGSLITTLTAVNGDALPVDLFNGVRSITRINNTLYVGTNKYTGSASARGIWIYDYDSNTGKIIDSTTPVDSGTQLPDDNITNIIIDSINNRIIVGFNIVPNFYFLDTTNQYTIGNASRADLTFTATETYKVKFDILTANTDTFNLTVGGDIIDLTAEPIGTFDEDITVASGGSLLKFDAANDNAVIANLAIQSRQYLIYTTPKKQNGYRATGLIVTSSIDIDCLVSSGSQNFVVKSMCIASSDDNQPTQPFVVNWLNANGDFHSTTISPVKDAYQSNNTITDLVIKDDVNPTDTSFFRINAINNINWNVRAGSNTTVLLYLDSNTHLTDAFLKSIGRPDLYTQVQKQLGVYIADNPFGKGIFSVTDQQKYIQHVKELSSQLTDPEERMISEKVVAYRKDAIVKIQNQIKIANDSITIFSKGGNVGGFYINWLWSTLYVYSSNSGNQDYVNLYSYVNNLRDKNGVVISGGNITVIVSFMNFLLSYWRQLLSQAKFIQNKVQYNQCVGQINKVISISSLNVNEAGEETVKSTVNTNIFKKKKKQVLDVEPEEISNGITVIVKEITQNPDKDVPVLVEAMLLGGKNTYDIKKELIAKLGQYIPAQRINDYVDIAYKALLSAGKIDQEPTINTGGVGVGGQKKSTETVVSKPTAASKPSADKAKPKEAYEYFGLNGLLISVLSVAFFAVISEGKK